MPAIAGQKITNQTPYKKRAKLLPESFERDLYNLMRELLHRSLEIFLAWHAMSLQKYPFLTKHF